ncbi:hypothetical protein BAOM_4333 [Peribacillus asahii]|uniref:Two component regulator three Y domain-containing protein n=1 Tax=Peribacillus asahii TaxID=228899 RepID=A0A3Q9RS25_9BACI|nr:triple tyrosine motif-containing protein [Peribacillus asahii]AZV44913.1 hypothetical protein BAOM_4333 [Peribacillus asahii]
MRQIKGMIGVLSFLCMFSFFITTAEAAKIEAEPNNVREKATSIKLLEEVEGSITNNSDVDFYRVSLSTKGTFRVHSILGNEFDTNRNYYESYKLRLYNASGQLIQTSTAYGAYLENELFYFQKIEAALEKGTYYIAVQVTNNQFTFNNEPYLLLQEFNDGKVSITSLKSNVVSPQPTNKTIKWTAKAKGVDLQYKFSVYSNKKWTTLQNYSSKSSVNWTPNKAGKYKVKVTVRNTVSGKTVSKESSYTVFKPSDFSIVSFTANKKSPQIQGTTITYTVKTKGSYLEYRYRVYEKGKWYTAKNYSSKKSYSAFPYYTGTYKVAVDVRQKGTNKVKTKIITLTIKEAPAYRMNLNYDYSKNSASFFIDNNGSKTLTVNKIQLYNGNKVIYSYSPKNWTVKVQGSKTFTFKPKNRLATFNSSTYSKITYTYDGIKHTGKLY